MWATSLQSLPPGRGQTAGGTRPPRTPRSTPTSAADPKKSEAAKPRLINVKTS